MTNKEAIAILTHNWKYRELIDNGYQYEALDLAIKAIKALTTIISIVDDSENLIKDRYGAVIVEGYADVVDEIKMVIAEYREAENE